MTPPSVSEQHIMASVLTSAGFSRRETQWFGIEYLYDLKGSNQQIKFSLYHGDRMIDLKTRMIDSAWTARNLTKQGKLEVITLAERVFKAYEKECEEWKKKIIPFEQR
jgi:hypothetical protein